MKFISTNDAPQAIGPYSQGVIIGDVFYSSGQIPLTPAGELVAKTIEEQTHQVFKNLQGLLQAAGSSLDSVIKATVFIKNMDDFPTINDIYASYFGEHKPARSCVEVARLPKDVLLEIEVIAAVNK